MNCPRCQWAIKEGQRFCTHCGAVMPGAGEDPMIGRVLGAKYELVAKLGEGGMGTVYRARRIHIGDEVAIKVLHPNFVRDQDAVARFRREARAAALLQHPNIVAIYDYGEEAGDDPLAYIVMELVRGQTLRQILKQERKLDPARAVALMREVCAGVGAGHRRQVLHRDLKPDNIIVLPPDGEADGDEARERVKVVDFGIAKLRDLAADLTLTDTGMVLGTPYYMSPEQCRGETLDSRSDVYSLGAVLYELLAGAPPFTGASATAVVAKQLTAIPQPLTAFAQVPRALEAIVFRALAKEPQDRPSDAVALARDLGSALSPTAARIAPLQAVALDPPQTIAQHQETDTIPRRPKVTAPASAVRTPDFAMARATHSSRAPLAIGLALVAVALLAGAGLWASRSGGVQRAAVPSPPPAIPDSPSPTAAPTTPTPSPEPSPTPQAAEVAEAEMIGGGVGARVSSTRSPSEIYGPAATRDDNLETAWCPEGQGPGIGEWIEFTFSPQEIGFIDIFPGDGKSRELFEANHHLKRATLIFSDGTKVQGLFSDDMRVQTVALSRPVHTSSLKLIIEEVYAGTKYDDTLISEIHWR